MDTGMDTNNKWGRDVTVSDRQEIVGHKESVPLMTFTDSTHYSRVIVQDQLTITRMPSLNSFKIYSLKYWIYKSSNFDFGLTSDHVTPGMLF